MDEQLQRYESYAGGIKRLLLLSGLWPGHVTWNIFQLTVIVVYSITSIITSVGVVYFIANVFNSDVKNLGLVTKGLGIALGFSVILLKLLVFTMYRDHHEELHGMLDKTFRKDLENPEYRCILLSPLRYFYRPTLWLTISTCVIISMYNIIPPASLVIQFSHGVEVLQRRTPFPTKYPFPDTNLFYISRYAIEVTASLAMGTISACSDALFGFYIFQLASQFRVLSYRMSNLTVSDDHRVIIKECVLRRQILAECRDKLQTIYGPIIIWMLTSSAMIMCTNIFQASQMSRDKVASCVAFIYIIMKLIQTLLYGWYGLFLTIESEAFQESIYLSAWPGCADKSFLSNVAIMLVFKPFALRACHMFTVSLEMFMMIMHTALSYFVLLRTLDEK